MGAKLSSCGIVVLGLAVGMAGCQSNATSSSSDADQGMSMSNGMNGTPTAGDRQFMMDAAAAGAYEIDAGNLAEQKSSNQQVKNIAQHLVQDHTKANDQLMGIAQSEGVVVNAQPNADQNQLLDQLRQANGSSFDSTYLQQQAKGHREVIAKFEAEARTGTGAAKNFAKQTLPTLRKHLQMVTTEMNKLSQP